MLCGVTRMHIICASTMTLAVMLMWHSVSHTALMSHLQLPSSARSLSRVPIGIR